MKKVFAAIGVVLGLILLAIIVIPFVVDVDKYRPQIVSAANEHLNGKLELGSLKLSLWGHINIDIDGLKLSDSSGRSVVEVKDAAFNLPLMSLISGKPELRLEMVQPAINVIKFKNGKLNLATLSKPAVVVPTSPGQASGQAAPQAKKAEAKPALPPIVLAARFTLLIDQARVLYKDEGSGDSYKINDLGLHIYNISPNGKISFDLAAQLDLLAQKKIKVVGPLHIKGDLQTVTTASGFEKADGKIDLSLAEVEITYPETFHKPKGVPLGINTEFGLTTSTFAAKSFRFIIGEVIIDSQASAKTSAASTLIDFKAASNTISLQKLAQMLPSAKDANINGLLELDVKANGPTDRLDYAANVKVNKIVITHESMQQPLTVNATVAVVTDQVKDLTLTLNAPKNFDLKFNGSLQGFTAPRFKFFLTSSNLDVDGLMKPKPKPDPKQKETAQNTGSTDSASGTKSQEPAKDYNAMFEPLRENKMAASSSGTLDMNLKRIRSSNVEITDFQGQFALNDLTAALKNISMKIFEGSIKADMSINAKPVKPQVATKLVVANLQTKSMTESQMPLAKNTVRGAISADLNLGGAGLNQSDINTSWKGSGGFSIKDAVFSTMDIGKQLKEGVIEKLPPQAKGKVESKNLASYKGEYEIFSARFGLDSGTLSITEIVGKAYPRKGLDVRGNGTVKLADYALNLNLDIIDMYNLMNAEHLAKDPRYGHFAVSPRVVGTLVSPKFDWGTTVTRLAENAMRSQGKQAILKAADKYLGNKAPAATEALNKVLGGNSGNQNQSAPAPAPAAVPPPPPAPKPAEAVKKMFGR